MDGIDKDSAKGNDFKKSPMNLQNSLRPALEVTDFFQKHK